MTLATTGSGATLPSATPTPSRVELLWTFAGNQIRPKKTVLNIAHCRRNTQNLLSRSYGQCYSSRHVKDVGNMRVVCGLPQHASGMRPAPTCKWYAACPNMQVVCGLPLQYTPRHDSGKCCDDPVVHIDNFNSRNTWKPAGAPSTSAKRSCTVRKFNL